jgi:branched-chain amino acid transport system permease protein
VGLSFDLLINALIAGILLGGFYAAVTIGVSISFGILDIVNIAHPAFIILGSYIAYIVNTRLGIKSITNHSSGAGRKRCAACLSSSACCSSPR